jgi:deazaflavin-dependent oxidoreductase (nitroreductase family)
MQPSSCYGVGLHSEQGATHTMSDFNSNLIAQIRAGNGHLTDGPFAGRQVLVLTTNGANSNEKREAPLVYSRDGDDIVIVASMGGAPSHPAWYHNIVANPRVTIEVDGRKLVADARIVADGEERRRLYDQHAELHQSFFEYEAKTGGRVIPVIVLTRVTATAAA